MSALTVKVIAFNVLALIVFIAGAWWMQTIRVSLVDERIKSLRAQAQIVAGALASFGAVGEIDSETATEIDAEKAGKVLNILVGPTGMRARIFDRQGRRVQDTRFILTRNQVQSRELPPPGQIDLMQEMQTSLRSGLYKLRPGKELPPVVNDEPQQTGDRFDRCIDVAVAQVTVEAGDNVRGVSDQRLELAPPAFQCRLARGIEGMFQQAHGPLRGQNEDTTTAR